MANKSSWFPMSIYDKSAPKGIWFGPAQQTEHTSYMYPNEVIPKDATVIWVPAEHKTVSLASYERAHEEGKYEDLCKIGRLGIPLGCSFGGLIKKQKVDKI